MQEREALPFVYRRPHNPIDSLWVSVIYVRDTAVSVTPGWEDKAVELVEDCAAFHKRVFGAEARVSWFLHGPVECEVPGSVGQNQVRLLHHRVSSPFLTLTSNDDTAL